MRSLHQKKMHCFADRSRFPHMKSSIKLSAEEKDLSMFESFTVSELSFTIFKERILF